MLKGSLSYYPPAGKLALLFVLLLTFLLFSSLLGILVLLPFLGPQILNELASPDYNNPSLVHALKIIQILNMTGGLLLPAVLYSYLTDRRPALYLKLHQLPPWLPFVLAAFLILAVQPLIGFTNELNSHLKLPLVFSGIEHWMRDSEDQAQKITDAFLSSTSIGGLSVNIFMIALLPGICEEILFRGVLAQLFREWTRNTHWAVFISSLIFAGIHLQFYGFLPRFLLGMVLGYLFFWSGNLWLPMVAHFVNNLLSVIVEFLFRRGLITLDADQFGFSQSYYVVAGSIFFTLIILFYNRKAHFNQVRADLDIRRSNPD